MLSILTAITASLLASTSAEPAKVRPCSGVLDEVCGFYDRSADRLFIDLPDGTYVTNPRYRPPTKLAGSAKPADFADEAVMARTMEAIDTPKLSTAAKLRLSSIAPELFDTTIDRVRVPWPLGGAGASPQDIPRAKVVDELKRLVGPSRFDQYRTQVVDHAAAIRAYQDAQFAIANAKTKAVDRLMARFADSRAVADREAQVRGLFERARADVLRVVTGGAPEGQWTAEQKNLVSRVTSFELKFVSFADGERSPYCQGYAPNMDNSAARGVISVCPGYLWTPDVNVVETFAHELTHSFDPCAVQNDLASLDVGRLRKITDEGKLDPKDAAVLEQFIKNDFKYEPHQLSAAVQGPQTRSTLISEGVIKTLKPRLDGLPALYKDIYACLGTRYGFQRASFAARENLVGAMETAWTDAGQFSAAEIKTAKHNLRAYAEDKPDCNVKNAEKFVRPNQMNEAIADAVGAVAKERWLTDHPPRTEDEKMLSQDKGAEACAAKGAATEPASLAATEMVGAAARQRKASQDEHPVNWKRFELGMDLPGLAKTYGCTRDQAGCFDSLSLVPRSTTGGSPGEVQSAH